MSTRRQGFTLVELLVVALLTAVTLAGVYRTLVVQEKSYETAGLKIHDQESLRTAVGILESELREIGSIGGADIGGTDIIVASPDSILFRAQRKMGFVCTLSRADKWVLAWPVGEPFASGDELLVFVDGDTLAYRDDSWDVMAVGNASDTNDSACESRWPGKQLQLLKLNTDADLAGVYDGAPMRAYEWVTYGLYSFGHLGYGLGRNLDDGRGPAYLVGGLAGPGEGLVFEYFTPDGVATTDPTAVGRVRITVKTDPQTNTSVQSTSLSTDLFLRNN